MRISQLKIVQPRQNPNADSSVAATTIAASATSAAGCWPKPTAQTAAVTDRTAPIPCANRLGGPGTYFGGRPRRGVTTRVANWPSGLERRARGDAGQKAVGDDQRDPRLAADDRDQTEDHDPRSYGSRRDLVDGIGKGKKLTRIHVFSLAPSPARAKSARRPGPAKVAMRPTAGPCATCPVGALDGRDRPDAYPRLMLRAGAPDPVSPLRPGDLNRSITLVTGISQGRWRMMSSQVARACRPSHARAASHRCGRGVGVPSRAFDSAFGEPHPTGCARKVEG